MEAKASQRLIKRKLSCNFWINVSGKRGKAQTQGHALKSLAPQAQRCAVTGRALIWRAVRLAHGSGLNFMIVLLNYRAARTNVGRGKNSWQRLLQCECLGT